MKFKFVFFIVCCFISLSISNAQSNIQINEESSITRLMDHYVKVNRAITHVSGWRITIITTTDRRQVEDAKINFQKNFSRKP